MNYEQFCYWLKGYMTYDLDILDKELIKKELDNVILNASTRKNPLSYSPFSNSDTTTITSAWTSSVDEK